MYSIGMLQGHYCCGVGSAGTSTKHLLVALISLIYSWLIVAFWELSAYVRAKAFLEEFGCILMSVFL